MGAVFRVRNQNSGLIQIDQNYINYAVRSTSTLNMATFIANGNAEGQSGNIYQDTITVAASPAAVIGYVSSMHVYLFRQTPVSGGFELMFRSFGTGAISVYVFDSQQYGYIASSSHAVLRLRRNDGSLIMDSRMVQMRVLEFIHTSDINFPTVTRSYPGKRPCIVQSQRWMSQIQQPLPGTPPQEIDVYLSSSARVSSDSVVFTTTSFGNTPHTPPTVPPPTLDQLTSDYCIVDLTGLA